MSSFSPAYRENRLNSHLEVNARFYVGTDASVCFCAGSWRGFRSSTASRSGNGRRSDSPTPGKAGRILLALLVMQIRWSFPFAMDRPDRAALDAGTATAVKVP